MKSWSFPWDSCGTPVWPSNALKVLVLPMGSQFCHRNPDRVLVLPLGSSGESSTWNPSPAPETPFRSWPYPRESHGTPVLPRGSWFCSWDPHGTPNLPTGLSASPHPAPKDLEDLTSVPKNTRPWSWPLNLLRNPVLSQGPSRLNLWNLGPAQRTLRGSRSCPKDLKGP